MKKQRGTLCGGLLATVLLLTSAPASAQTRLVEIQGGGDSVVIYSVGESDINVVVSGPSCNSESYDLAPGQEIFLKSLSDGRYRYNVRSTMPEPPPPLSKLRDEERGQGYCLQATTDSGSFLILEGSYVDPSEPEK